VEGLVETLGQRFFRRDLGTPEIARYLALATSPEAADPNQTETGLTYLIAAFLLGLRTKGETVEEITGCAMALRERAVSIAAPKGAIDTCGTGGDNSGTFNISTAAAIIAGSAGVVVAKHGNKAVSSTCGSADVLTELGIKIDNSPERVSQILDEVGITFLYAPLHHGAMKHAGPVRNELGIRTIFNILGPLANPAGTKRQVLGVYKSELTEPMAHVLGELGSDHALVVHGEGGLDELSTLGKTRVSELRSGKVRTYELDAADYGFSQISPDSISGGNAQVNGAILRNIFEGGNGAPAEIAVYNAGAALVVGGKASDLKEGVEIARSAVRSGLAKRKLEQWIEASRS